MTTNAANLKILHLGVDDCGLESYFRVLVDCQKVKYISIDGGIYDTDDLCFPPALLSKLPPLPPGDWNLAHIAKSSETTKPHFAWSVQKAFRGITHAWHATKVDYLSLSLGKMLMANVYEASSAHFDTPVIAKLARFPWEIDYYEAETEAYAWIEGHGIGPRFLGHLTEEGRIIGFLLERVEGRHAVIGDLSACRAVVSKLHDLGIVHGDLNKHNFLVFESRVVLLDFETAVRSEDTDAMDRELRMLEQQLRNESGKGAIVTVSPELEAELSEINRRDGGCCDELLEQARKGKITITGEQNREMLKRQRGEPTT
ncbi:MAG: hypothetical protein M1830_008579 [Pleopsidium flavum]|nr:MAG: hypothetical protein M1830_008579 [Pleopsidium flavum]